MNIGFISPENESGKYTILRGLLGNENYNNIKNFYDFKGNNIIKKTNLSPTNNYLNVVNINNIETQNREIYRITEYESPMKFFQISSNIKIYDLNEDLKENKYLISDIHYLYIVINPKNINYYLDWIIELLQIIKIIEKKDLRIVFPIILMNKIDELDINDYKKITRELGNKKRKTKNNSLSKSDYQEKIKEELEKKGIPCYSLWIRTYNILNFLTRQYHENFKELPYYMIELFTDYDNNEIHEISNNEKNFLDLVFQSEQNYKKHINRFYEEYEFVHLNEKFNSIDKQLLRKIIEENYLFFDKYAELNKKIGNINDDLKQKLYEQLENLIKNYYEKSQNILFLDEKINNDTIYYFESFYNMINILYKNKIIDFVSRKSLEMKIFRALTMTNFRYFIDILPRIGTCYLGEIFKDFNFYISKLLSIYGVGVLKNGGIGFFPIYLYSFSQCKTVLSTFNHSYNNPIKILSGIKNKSFYDKIIKKNNDYQADVESHFIDYLYRSNGDVELANFAKLLKNKKRNHMIFKRMMKNYNSILGNNSNYFRNLTKDIVDGKIKPSKNISDDVKMLVNSPYFNE